MSIKVGTGILAVFLNTSRQRIQGVVFEFVVEFVEQLHAHDFAVGILCRAHSCVSALPDALLGFGLVRNDVLLRLRQGLIQSCNQGLTRGAVTGLPRSFNRLAKLP